MEREVVVYKDRVQTVEKIIEQPIITEKIIEVEKIVERPIEIIKIVEVEKIVEVIKEVEKIITREEENCDCLTGLRFVDVWNRIFNIKGMASGECLTSTQFVELISNQLINNITTLPERLPEK